MRIRLGDGLLPLNLLAILLIAVIMFSAPIALRIVLGIPFVLYFPGYTLMLALFPSKKAIGGTERVVLSFALSIALVPLTGLILNYTPWGIALDSVLYSIASFILITSLVGWIRRMRLQKETRFSLDFRLRLPPGRRSVRNWTLFVVFLITVLGVLAVLAYVIAAPKITDKFTEFYILGTEGKAKDYLEELVVGEEGRMIVGIVNHEHETINYSIEVIVNGVKENEVEMIALQNEEKWQGIISFTAKVPGENQKVEFLLYRNGEIDSSLKPLYLWFNVTE